jgi:hypothetical protein
MPNMELPQKVYQAQNRILERCIEISKSEEVPAVYVIIQFRWETIAYDIEKTASALVSLVKKVVPSLSKVGQYRSDINPLDGILQFVVKSPNYNGVNWCDDHRWERAIVHNLMPNPIEEIQQRINEKNAKHTDYLKKCTKCWLLITAEGWQFPQAFILTQETKNHVFRSTFEKAFFLEVIDQELIELRTES